MVERLRPGKRISYGELLEKAKKDGFDNIKDWNKWRIDAGKMPDMTIIKRKENEEFLKRNGFKNNKEYLDYLAQRKLCDNFREYRDEWAQNKGYEDSNEYLRELKWKQGKKIPFDTDEYCSAYLGVYIAERKVARIILPRIFKKAIEKEMSLGNPGFDFIIGGYKVDVKSSSLLDNRRWMFQPKYNKMTDYFLCIAFDNRENLYCMYVWLFKGDQIIKGRKFYKRFGFSITDKPTYVNYFIENEYTNMLNEQERNCKE